MNRELKFRAWNDKIKWMSKPFTFGQVLNFHDQIIKGLTNDEIVMQFTGLKDKNGVDVYEFDYVLDKHNQRILVQYDFSLLSRLKEIEKELVLDGNCYE